MNNDALSDGVKGKKHTSPFGRRFGWNPAAPNRLQHKKYADSHKIFSYPPKHSNADTIPYVFDQGDSSSCTANAGCYMFGQIHNVQKIEDAFSRLFYYWQERDYENDTTEDGGASISDGILLLATRGVCKESTYPFDLTKLFTKPSQLAYKEALAYKIHTKTYLSSKDEYRSCLASGKVFNIGITCFDNLDGAIVASTGLLSMPGPESKPTGGHAICLVGYDSDFHNSEAFKDSGLTPEQYPWNDVYEAKNSWGQKWGRAGSFFLPATYIETNDISSDGWNVT